MTGPKCTNPPPESCSDYGCPVRGLENTWSGARNDDLADYWAPLRGSGPCPGCGVPPGAPHKPHAAEGGS